jgi:hypothetical protein
VANEASFVTGSTLVIDGCSFIKKFNRFEKRKIKSQHFAHGKILALIFYIHLMEVCWHQFCRPARLS